MMPPSLRRTVSGLLFLVLSLSAPLALYAQQADLHVRIDTIEGALAFDPVAKTSVIPLGREVTFRIWVANRGDGEATGALVNGGADPAFFEIREATIDPAVAVCEVNPLGFFICPQMTLPAGDSALVQVTGVGLMLTAAAQKTAGALFSTTTGGPNAGSDDDITDMEIVEAVLGSFQGVAFQDTNGDGMQQTNEPGLAGRMIFNDVDANAQYDPGTDPSMPTDATGFYRFTDVELPATLGQVVPQGWEDTFPVGGFHTINEDGQEANFGSRPVSTASTDLAVLKRARTPSTGDEVDPGDTLTVARGDTITYRISVANTSTAGGGPNDSPDTVVLDQLPGDVAYVSATSSRGTCRYDAATRLVTCELGTVGAGEQLLDVIEITVVATGASGTTVPNTASVVGDLPDPDAANDESTVSVTTVEGDLAITKEASTQAPGFEAVFFYILTVTNTGPADAPNTVVRDTLDARLAFISATATQGTCSFSATDRVLTCDLGTVRAGDTVQIRIAVRSDSQTRGVSNTATVESALPELDYTNNTDDVLVLVQEFGDKVTVTKEVSTDAAVVGDTLVYTITLDANVVLRDVFAVIADTLSEKVAFVGIETDEGLFDCRHTIVDRVLTITCKHRLGNVFPETTIRIITVAVQAGLCPNIATVEAFKTTATDTTLLTMERDTAMVAISQSTPTEPEADLPETFILYDNYPNPFNPATTVRFDLPEAARIRLEVYDLLGRRVLTMPPQHAEAGAGRTFYLDASGLASGVYLYRLVAEAPVRTYTATGRMVLAR